MIRNVSLENNLLKLEIDLTSNFAELNQVLPVTVGGLNVKVKDLPFIPGEPFVEIVAGLIAPEME